jgi:hypothetical protein
MYFPPIFSWNTEQLGVFPLIERSLVLQEKTGSSQCTKQEIKQNVANTKQILFHRHPTKNESFFRMSQFMPPCRRTQDRILTETEPLSCMMNTPNFSLSPATRN